jgi:hypothetical protein
VIVSESSSATTLIPVSAFVTETPWIETLSALTVTAKRSDGESIPAQGPPTGVV